MTALEAAIGELSEAADRLALDLYERASGRTTAGRERAILRMLGVTGLDARGGPLAAQVVDGYVAGSTDRLATGVALPFAMAVVEYDASPQSLALDIAAGTIDLAMEADLLRVPARRASAVSALGGLIRAAADRVDANRTASRELLAVLGDAARPWVGTTLAEPGAIEALDEAGVRVRAGADVLRVAIPAGSELRFRLAEAGQDVPGWVPRAGTRTAEAGEGGAAPTGSQRGIAALRAALDRAGAERAALVRLTLAPPALGAPEAAIVAAFERADLVELDPMAEIVGVGVDPDRALADLVFAAHLLRRSGTGVVLPAGALVVGPEILAGRPVGPDVRSGRALALQLLALRMLRAAGLPAEQIIVVALPPWHMDEGDAVARAAGEVALRRELMGEHGLAFLEPGTDGLVRSPGADAAWPFLVAALLDGEHIAHLVSRRATGSASSDEGFAGAAAAVRGASRVAMALHSSGAGRGVGDLDGTARAHAEGVVRAAAATLHELVREGWQGLLGGQAAPAQGIGADAVALRSADQDPLEQSLADAPT